MLVCVIAVKILSPMERFLSEKIIVSSPGRCLWEAWCPRDAGACVPGQRMLL